MKTYGKRSTKTQELLHRARLWEALGTSDIKPIETSTLKHQSEDSDSDSDSNDSKENSEPLENLASNNENICNPTATPEEVIDLTKKLESVAIDDSTKKDTNDLIESLLEYCEQSKLETLTKSFASFEKPVQKIGEATYSDVYLIDDDHPKAVKVIPIGGQDQLSLDTALMEVKCTSVTSKIKCNRDGDTQFIKLYKCSLAVGKYPAFLKTLWDKYDKEYGSENLPPQMYKKDQLYLILFLEFGGTDLEHTSLVKTSKSMISVLLQTIILLAQGEEQINFEHRDLHWGNILLEATNEKSSNYTVCNKDIKISLNQIRIKIIDFTLCRYGKDQVIYNNLGDDLELFQGPGPQETDGDLQFDIYRWMQKLTNNDWETHNPKTNVYWVYYLVDKLSTFDIQLPKEIKQFSKRVLDYESCQHIVKQEILDKSGIFNSIAKIK